MYNQLTLHTLSEAQINHGHESRSLIILTGIMKRLIDVTPDEAICIINTTVNNEAVMSLALLGELHTYAKLLTIRSLEDVVILMEASTITHTALVNQYETTIDILKEKL